MAQELEFEIVDNNKMITELRAELAMAEAQRDSALQHVFDVKRSALELRNQAKQYARTGRNYAALMIAMDQVESHCQMQVKMADDGMKRQRLTLPL